MSEVTAPPTDDVEERAAAARSGTTLSFHARRRPDDLAIVSASGDRTLGELDGNANRLVRALRSRGVRAGDGVALICGNRPEFAEVVAACLRSGLRLTPVNWHLNADEARYIVEDCEATALIAEASVSTTAVEAAAPAVLAQLAIGGAIDGFESYDDALAAADATPLTDPTPGTTSLYTSGTTGRPKGVRRDHPDIDCDSVNLGRYRPGDVHLCTGPLYHAAPLVISLLTPTIFHGAATVLMERWDAREALDLIARHRVTHTHMVATMFHRLLALPDEVRTGYDVSSLKLIIHGAAPCPVPLKRRLIDWVGPIVVEYYSATEGYGCIVDSATWLQRPGTVGKPSPIDQVYVGDEDANPVPARTTGTVWIKTTRDNPFRYHGDEAKTAGAHRGEHFTLGDIGHLDDDGYLYLTDRSANLIISGGVNIYPAQVDAVLLDHPAVGDVGTIGVPDDEWGETVLAVVELRDGHIGSDALEAEMITFCRERLPSFACPRRVDFVDELPRQDNGKLYKRMLRDRYRS